MLTISAWKNFGTRGGIRTHAKLNWQKTDYCCSSHTFWAQECYPPSTLSLVFILVCLITTVAVINGSRPCLLNSNLSSYGLPYLIPSFCVKPASCESHSLQTVVPDELFHFVWNKLALGDQMRNSLFNHYWSRRVLPEVPLSWWGLVSIPLSFPYGKLSVRPDIIVSSLWFLPKHCGSPTDNLCIS